MHHWPREKIIGSDICDGLEKIYGENSSREGFH